MIEQSLMSSTSDTDLVAELERILRFEGLPF
jgi:hypothetical protein